MRTTAFRWLWTAQLAANVGSWMQTVAAQWLMVSLTTSAALVGAVQTAASLPVLLLAIPAGILGDLVDRRRLLLVGQIAMLIASAGLGVAVLAGIVMPWLLLVSLAAVGAFNALTAPTWQSTTPELVPPRERSQAIALGSVNKGALGLGSGGYGLCWPASGWGRYSARASPRRCTGRSPGGRSPRPAASSSPRWRWRGRAPAWVKARGLGYHLVAFQGANALGALLWGAVAEATSVRTALLVLAAALVLDSAATWPLPVAAAGSIDERAAEPLAVPDLASPPRRGPVLVTIVGGARAPARAAYRRRCRAERAHRRAAPRPGPRRRSTTSCASDAERGPLRRACRSGEEGATGSSLTRDEPPRA